MAFKLLVNSTAIGASRAVHLSPVIGAKDHSITCHIKPNGVAAPTAVTLNLQGSMENTDAVTGVVTGAGLKINSSGGSSTKWVMIGTTFTYLINNTNYTVATNTAGQAFSAAHVIGNGSDDVFGCINIYINAAGTISTDVPASPQVYTSAALAYAAGAALTYDPSLCKIGYLMMEANAATFTANTSALTLAGTTVQYVSLGSSFRDILVHQATAAEIAAGHFYDSIRGIYMPYMRLFLSVLTGSAIINGRYAPEDSP